MLTILAEAEMTTPQECYYSESPLGSNTAKECVEIFECGNIPLVSYEQKRVYHYNSTSIWLAWVICVVHFFEHSQNLTFPPLDDLDLIITFVGRSAPKFAQ